MATHKGAEQVPFIPLMGDSNPVKVRPFKITFWLAVVTLPLPSLNVQVTTVVPNLVMGKGVVVVPVTMPAQLSVVVGVGGVMEVASHALSVMFGRVGFTGGIVSFTITVWVAVLELPLESVNVQCTV